MPAPIRRLGLLDVMILVAAIAPGITWSRFVHTQQEHPYNVFEANPEVFGTLKRPMRHAIETAWDWYGWVGPAVATGAVGLLALRLRTPRPRARRALIQPGGAACAAVAAGLIVAVIRVGVDLVNYLEQARIFASKGLSTGTPWWWVFYGTFHPAQIGAMVLGAWAALAISGRMRGERSTIDRLGRGVGIFWIAGLALSLAVGGS